MTLTSDTTAPSNDARPLVAERWLLASDDAQRLFALPAALDLAAAQSPLLAWRLQQDLVQRLPLKALPEKLADALASGASGVNIWADMDADALDALVWQQVPVERQPQVTWQAWPATTGDGADGDAAVATFDADAGLLQALARPDAWAEVTWRLGGCEAPPAVVARRTDAAGADKAAAAAIAGHAAAFAKWAAAQWQGMDSDALVEARSRDDVRIGLELPMADQTQPEALPPPSLPVVELAQPVRAVPDRARPRTLQGAPAVTAAAAGGSQVDGWTTLVTREGHVVQSRGRRRTPHYLLHLEEGGRENGSQGRLRLRVLLQPDRWDGSTDLQLWFVPDHDEPVLLRMRPPMLEGGWLVSRTPLRDESRGIDALVALVRDSQVGLSGETPLR